MQITAKLIQLLPIQSGTGKNGQWKKQDIIVETNDNFPKKVCISIWGDKIDENQLQLGNILVIDYDIESKELNGKWYTNIKAWKISTDEGESVKSEESIQNKNHESFIKPDELMVGQKIKAKIRGFSLSPNSIVGTFITELGVTTAIIGKKSEFDFKKHLKLKGKECWLIFRRSIIVNGKNYPDFEIKWI